MTDLETHSGKPFSGVSDPALCSLDTLLDPKAMNQCIATEMGWGTSRYRTDQIVCSRESIWYRPGKSCSVVYRGLTPEQRTPFIAVGHVDNTKSPSSMSRHPFPSQTHRTETGMWLWTLPFDPALPSLKWLYSTAPASVYGRTPADQPKLPGSRQLLHYVPLRRCTMFLTQLGGDLGANHERVVAKLDRGSDPVQTRDVLSQLWQYCQSGVIRYRVVKPLSPLLTSSHQVLWQEWCSGQSFTETANQLGVTEAAQLVAEGLADFHQTPIRRLPRRHASAEQAKLATRSQALAEFQPDLRVQLDNLTSRLKTSEIFSDPVILTPIHGDFNDGQILFQQNRPVFLDLDGCALGDPHYDLGHFVAGLFRLAMKHLFSWQEVRHAETEFLRAYQRNVPWVVSRRRLNHSLALALVCRRAHKIMRQLEPGAIDKISAYIDYARAYLD